MDCCDSTNEYYASPTQRSTHQSGYFGDSTVVNEGDAFSADTTCNTMSKALLGVLGGAGIGAMLMYLLDSEQGPDRRERVAHSAEGAWDSMRNAASYVGAKAAYAGSRAKHRIADSGYFDEAGDRLDYLVHGRRSHGIESGTGQALTGVGLLALGIGAMYLLDANQGKRRRNELGQRFLAGFGRMATSIERLGKDLYNRGSGMVAETRGRKELVDDRTLVERVRAQMGHCVSNTGAIDISANNGAVIVSGHILNTEVDDLLKCIWRTRGVTELVNRLEVHNDLGALNLACSTAGQSNVSTYGTNTAGTGMRSVPNAT